MSTAFWGGGEQPATHFLTYYTYRRSGFVCAYVLRRLDISVRWPFSINFPFYVRTSILRAATATSTVMVVACRTFRRAVRPKRRLRVDSVPVMNARGDCDESLRVHLYFAFCRCPKT